MILGRISVGLTCRTLTVMASALLVACESGAQAPATARNGQTNPEFEFGVQTHFGQNWPHSWARMVEATPARHLRDSMAWSKAEQIRGEIRFDPEKLALMRKLCGHGVRFLLTAEPRNALYDSGNLVTSQQGRDAFVRYARALLDALPGCVDALEIGNEINSPRSLPVRKGTDSAAAYSDVLKATYGPLKEAAPHVTIVCGSTHSVGTGFVDQLARHDALDHVDAVSVHPYRRHAENLDWELARLNRTLSQHGSDAAVWATEFGDNFDPPERAGPAMLKLVSMMGSHGIDRAYWYALTDQRWFPDMGLFTRDGEPKPGADAYSFIVSDLLASGRPEAMSQDRLLKLYRFGHDKWVVWGTPRAIKASAGVKYFSASGREFDETPEVSLTPVVVHGPRPQFGQSPVIADSLFQYGDAPWSYHARKASGELVDLAPLDSRFTTRMERKGLRPMFMSDTDGATFHRAGGTVAAILRYTHVASGTVEFIGCFEPRAGDSVSLRVTSRGNELASLTIAAKERVVIGPVTLDRGDTIDFSLTPARRAEGPQVFHYRIIAYEARATKLSCPDTIQGWNS